MPTLSCSAVKCVYNENRLCGKGDIKVTGDHALEPRDTCCSSFRENASGTVKNSFGEPSDQIQVDCSACNCQYNKDMECQADRVDISGPSSSRCAQTECCTFEKK